LFVIPAEAGISSLQFIGPVEIPASAGMTMEQSPR